MRLFVAYVLSRSNQAVLDAATGALVAGTGQLLRAVPPGTAHLTFSFIPRAGDDDVARIAEGLRRLAASCAPIDISIAGVAILRARGVPRLVYAPIAIGHDGLERLAAGVHDTVRASAPHLETSPTASPHVTLARFRKTARPGDARSVEQALPGTALSSLDLRDVVSTLQLMRSSTTPSGPVYTELAATPLAPGHPTRYSCRARGAAPPRSRIVEVYEQDDVTRGALAACSPVRCGRR